MKKKTQINLEKTGIKKSGVNVTFRLQKLFSWFYIIDVIAVCLFTLWFMTDFMGLRGFVFSDTKAATDFYNLLQPFNQTLFYLSLVGVVSIVIVHSFDFKKYVVDYMGLILISIIALILIYASYDAITWFPVYKAEYLKRITTAVTDAMKEQNAATYVVKTRAFAIGTGVYIVNVIVVVLFVLFSWITNILFRKNQNNLEAEKSEVSLNER